VLRFTGDHDEASRVEALHLALPDDGWSPMRCTREAANDDVPLVASPDPIIHSGDFGLAWVPERRVKENDSPALQQLRALEVHPNAFGHVDKPGVRTSNQRLSPKCSRTSATG
jgi:hypothetical protein